MISAIAVKCKNCGTFDNFVSKDSKVSVRKVAEKAGWRERKAGWICPSCRLEEPDDSPEHK